MRSTAGPTALNPSAPAHATHAGAESDLVTNRTTRPTAPKIGLTTSIITDSLKKWATSPQNSMRRRQRSISSCSFTHRSSVVVEVVGHGFIRPSLPWRTMGLPTLRTGAGLVSTFAAMRTLALVVCLLALATAPASSVTLMVNGDTPSVRWQRVADAMLVKSFDGVIDLYSEECPDRRESSFGCFTPVGPQLRPAIYLAPGEAFTAHTLRHELGHAYAWQTGGDLSERYAQTYGLCAMKTRPTRADVEKWIGWGTRPGTVRYVCSTLTAP